MREIRGAGEKSRTPSLELSPVVALLYAGRVAEVTLSYDRSREECSWEVMRAGIVIRGSGSSSTGLKRSEYECAVLDLDLPPFREGVPTPEVLCPT